MRFLPNKLEEVIKWGLGSRGEREQWSYCGKVGTGAGQPCVWEQLLREDASPRGLKREMIQFTCVRDHLLWDS